MYDLNNSKRIIFGTGGCGSIGWFVGFVNEGNTTKVFAFNLRGKGASGVEAKKIVIDYFKKSKIAP